MDLPKNQDVFDFTHESELGNKWAGQFTVLCVLDIKTRHLLELEKTRLLGNYSSPTDELAGISIMLANLRLRIVDGPEWWKQSKGGYEFTDIDTLTSLYEKVMNAETEWRTKLKEKAKKLPEPSPTSP